MRQDDIGDHLLPELMGGKMDRLAISALNVDAVRLPVLPDQAKEVQLKKPLKLGSVDAIHASPCTRGVLDSYRLQWEAIGAKAGWTYGTGLAQAAGADGIGSNSAPETMEIEVDQYSDETTDVHVEVLFCGDGQP